MRYMRRWFRQKRKIRLEEFAWAFGDDAVEEMEKRSTPGHGTDCTNFRIWKRLGDVGFEEKLKNWHALGVWMKMRF